MNCSETPWVDSHAHLSMFDADEVESALDRAAAAAVANGDADHFAAQLHVVARTDRDGADASAAAIVRDIPKAILGRPLERELYWSRMATGALLVLSAFFALYMAVSAALNRVSKESPSVGKCETPMLAPITNL